MIRHRSAPALVPLMSLTLAGLLLVAVLDLPPQPGLVEPVAGAMDRAGVDHPVTAVLLNFRAYDTFLELAVLLLAVLAVWSLGRRDPIPARPVQGPVLHGTLRHLIPVAVVTGGYLVWVGSSDSGGAFQGGAVLGAAGVMLMLSRPRELPMLPAPLQHLGLALGVCVFLAVGTAGLLAGHGFMGYPPAWAYPLILGIELVAALSIALTLVLLFLGGRHGH